MDTTSWLFAMTKSAYVGFWMLENTWTRSSNGVCVIAFSSYVLYLSLSLENGNPPKRVPGVGRWLELLSLDLGQSGHVLPVDDVLYVPEHRVLAGLIGIGELVPEADTSELAALLEGHEDAVLEVALGHPVVDEFHGVVTDLAGDELDVLVLGLVELGDAEVGDMLLAGLDVAEVLVILVREDLELLGEVAVLLEEGTILDRPKKEDVALLVEADLDVCCCHDFCYSVVHSELLSGPLPLNLILWRGTSISLSLIILYDKLYAQSIPSWPIC